MSDQEFRLDIDCTRPDLAVISIVGVLDLYGAPKLKDVIINICESAPSRIVVDLAACDYLDSVALGVLVGGLKRCRSIDQELDLVVASGNVRRTFQITGLDRIFRILPTLEEALNHAGASSI